jgi:3-methyladenine DNA glycosylase AlkD
LESLSNPEAVAGMARFGINPERAYGVSIPQLRKLAKKAGLDSSLASELWASEIHEARILASMIHDPVDMTPDLMDAWVMDFNSWDLCDQCCNNLFRKAGCARAKAVEWSAGEEEFVKRAGFTLMACLAVHDKESPDSAFVELLGIISREANDNRNFVKKAVNWALRQIGKRNLNLNEHAIETAERISRMESKSARWIASNALLELTGEKVQERLRSS